MNMEYNSCLFCGNVVSQNEKNKDTDSRDSFDSFDIKNSSIDKEAVNKRILQISHYLQIGKKEIINEFDNDALNISICPQCWNISGKLSSLCGELEVIQMKIKYFLNLLTDGILPNNKTKTRTKSEKNQVDIQVEQSKFPQMFYQKCKN